ncbi:hypothetical protein KJ966_19360 [bacterium]|nr:hypothetical protein [bacterium]
MKKIAFTISFLIFSINIQIFAVDGQLTEAGLGFEFGTTFQRYQESNFRHGGSNFFRLNMRNPKGSIFYLHNENGSIGTEVGDAATTLNTSVIGIGSVYKLGSNFDLCLMVGNATITGSSEFGTGSNAISSIQSTSPVADIGVSWMIFDENASFAGGIAYRYLALSNPITFTNSSGRDDDITDLSALNLSLSITYSF